MKKLQIFIISLFLVFVLASCNQYNISEVLFIASVGIEKKEEGEEKYYGYFYLPLSSDIGKTENTENKGKGEFARVAGNTISDLFENLKVTTSLSLNFKHVSSIVLNTELLEKEFITELFDFIKFSLEIDYNCYVFATKEKLSDIYNFQNPNQESVLNSILVSTNDVSGIFQVASPMHFLEFARKYHGQRSILLPMLSLEEIWTVEDEKVKNFHIQSAVYYFKNQVKDVIKNPSSPYMLSIDQFDDKIKENSICFKNYKLNLDLKEKPILKISFNYEVFKTDSTLSKDAVIEYVKEKVQAYLEEFKEIDPLDLEYYSYVYGKTYTYEDLTIEIRPNIN